MRANIRTTCSAWLCLLAAGTASCGSTPPGLPDDGLSVLFVGNSLTAANDLPGMVAALAGAAGVERFRYQEATSGGSGLEDHWSDGRAVEAIEGARWDVVVLQQGPSSLESSRLNLIEWAGRFAEKIRERGGRPALYMVWPPLGGDWDAVTRSYTDAAVAVDGMLFPAGEALRAIHAEEPGIAGWACRARHARVSYTTGGLSPILEIRCGICFSSSPSSASSGSRSVRSTWSAEPPARTASRSASRVTAGRARSSPA
jgi:hypothetical protein